MILGIISKDNFLQIEIFFLAGGIKIRGSVVKDNDLLSNPVKCWMNNFGLTSGEDDSQSLNK